MKIKQITIEDPRSIGSALDPLVSIAPNLLLAFAAPDFFSAHGLASELRRRFPDVAVVGCSTAGEISMRGVDDGKAVVTAIRLERARLVSGTTDLLDMADSRAAGQRLAKSIHAADLRLVLVFCQGVDINGAALVEGMSDVLGASIPITGGLAGDSGAFEKTWTLGPSGVSDRALVALGLAGDGIEIGHGSFGGWESFGPARKVTRCADNILKELDGEPALGVYKRYLGDYADQLPASGLLFPFAMLSDDLGASGVIRSILGINEEQGSLTLAGNIEEGGYLKLMHASTDALVDGAENAARAAAAMTQGHGAGLAILVSCVGRKLVMGDRTDEELEAVVSVLGRDTVRAGFYSNGEISPLAPGGQSRLHNQTMTITTIIEH